MEFHTGSANLLPKQMFDGGHGNETEAIHFLEVSVPSELFWSWYFFSLFIIIIFLKH